MQIVHSPSDCTIQSSIKDQATRQGKEENEDIQCADAKAHVHPSEIKEGDTVFVRRDDTKRNARYSTPTGLMVTARNVSGTVTWNSSFFKKASIQSPETSDDEDSYGVVVFVQQN